MIKNYKILLQYDGTKYRGWQRQSNTPETIQGKIENVLYKMTGDHIEIAGAGRTDAGVHARGQVANFHIEEADPFFLLTNINKYLPGDIKVLSCEVVNDRFHSRLNAISKIYSYHIYIKDKKDVFSRKFTYGYDRELDIAAMNKAILYMIGEHDFIGFSSLKKSNRSTIRKINDITIVSSGKELVVTYDGNGFLYNMIRILTGTLIEIGSHQKDIGCIQQVFDTKNRIYAGYTAPPEGLFLEKIIYPSNGDENNG